MQIRCVWHSLVCLVKAVAVIVSFCDRHEDLKDDAPDLNGYS